MSQPTQTSLPAAPDSPALVVTANVQKFAVKKKKVLTAEESELFELTQAAGITVDQEVFKWVRLTDLTSLRPQTPLTWNIWSPVDSLNKMNTSSLHCWFSYSSLRFCTAAFLLPIITSVLKNMWSSFMSSCILGSWWTCWRWTWPLRQFSRPWRRCVRVREWQTAVAASPQPPPTRRAPTRHLQSPEVRGGHTSGVTTSTRSWIDGIRPEWSWSTFNPG